MYVSRLRLVNFRSYCDAAVEFGDGLNVVVGANATGKTNLLEGAWFALRGSSPRTRREEKLITWRERFARVELCLQDEALGPQVVDVAYAPGEGKRARWNAVEVSSQDDLRSRSQVFIFVPESLLLVKGSPARRRAHLDAFAAALDPPYAAAARELQAALRQRNAQLLAVKNGGSAAALDAWDVQFARAAVELGRRRRGLVAELAELFASVARELAPDGGSYRLQLVSQLAAVRYEEGALVEELRARRPGEIARGLSLYGPHRDDLRFLEVGADEAAHGAVGGAAGTPAAVGAASDVPEGLVAAVAADFAEAPAAVVAVDPAHPAPAAVVAVDTAAAELAGAGGHGGTAGGPSCGPAGLPRGGRDLRLFGSQGEQRAAVLALLLAEQDLAAGRFGRQGTLFLDDVMSELDDDRRRLLVRRLASAGQAIITTTNRHYFTEEELRRATVIELPLEGSLSAGEGTPWNAATASPAWDDADT